MFSSYGLPTMASEIVTLKNEIDGLRSVVKELCGRCYTLNTTATKNQINEMYNRYDKYGDGYTELVDVPSGFNFKTYTQQQWEDANYRLFNIQKYASSNSNPLVGLCTNNKSITNLDLSLWNTKNITNMFGVFYGCSSLTILNLSSWDTSSVTDVIGIFLGCTNLQTLDLSSWDISSVNNMTDMFQGCSSLTTLDLSNFDTSIVNNMSRMFYGCSNLTTLDLSNPNFIIASINNEMFNGCTSLTTVYYSDANKAVLQTLLASLGLTYNDTTGAKPAWTKPPA